MNDTIERYARGLLNDMLPQCTEGEQLMFKRMYAPKELWDSPIEDTIAAMDASKLSWAVTQVENTLAKKVSK